MTEVGRERAKTNGLAITALIMGIFSIPLNFLGLGLLPAGLAWTFAFLSRGQKRMCASAQLGAYFAAIGLIPFFVIGIPFLVHFCYGLDMALGLYFGTGGIY